MTARKGNLNNVEHTLIPMTVKMIHSAVQDCAVTMTTISIAIRDWQSASHTQNDNDVKDRSPSTITIMIIIAIKMEYY